MLESNRAFSFAMNTKLTLNNIFDVERTLQIFWGFFKLQVFMLVVTFWVRHQATTLLH
jgi:hypothetical protein